MAGSSSQHSSSFTQSLSGDIPNPIPEVPGTEESEIVQWMSDEDQVKLKTRKSEVWKYFQLSKDGTKCRCRNCGTEYVADSKKGTGHLNRHMAKCAKPATDPSQPRMSASSSNPFAFAYNQERDREGLAKMLVQTETPFLFAENDAFNNYITSALQPQHKKISRKTITNECKKGYKHMKEILKADLASQTCRVSLTADAWDGGYGLHYICVTAHWIDVDWVLQKRIIYFNVLEYPHTGLNIASHLMEALLSYNLNERLMSVTFDNASSMTFVASHLKNVLSDYILDDEALHMRCACHVLHLCVTDGRKAIGPYLEKIRGAVLAISSSGSRIQDWKSFCTAMGKKPIKMRGETPTRWSSTFLMLRKAIAYKDVVTRFYNSRFVSHTSDPLVMLTENDWDKCSKYMAFLELFHNITKMFSTVYTPCAPSFLSLALLVANLFDEHRSDHAYDEYLPSMEAKWRKYFTYIPNIFIYAMYLDPRHKYQGTYIYLDMYWKALGLGSDDELRAYKESVTNKFHELYDLYQVKFGSTQPVHPTPTSASQGGNKRAKGLFAKAASLVASKYAGSSSETQSDMTELQMYIKYDFCRGMPAYEKEGLDLLAWWKAQESKHPVLAAMVKDIYAVQVSSVASERAFSASGRVLDDRRSRLTPETLQMCVCYKDWLDALERKQDSSYDLDADYSSESSSTSTSSAAVTIPDDDVDYGVGFYD